MRIGNNYFQGPSRFTKITPEQFKRLRTRALLATPTNGHVDVEMELPSYKYKKFKHHKVSKRGDFGCDPVITCYLAPKDFVNKGNLGINKWTVRLHV